MPLTPVDDKFDPVKREDLADDNPRFLSRRIDLLASEMSLVVQELRALPRLVGERVERLLDQFVARLDEHSRRHSVHEERLDDHAARLQKLEALATSKSPRRKKR